MVTQTQEPVTENAETQTELPPVIPSELKPHKVSLDYPKLDLRINQDLEKSISRNGIREPIKIVLEDGEWQIVDGRHRWEHWKSLSRHQELELPWVVIPEGATPEEVAEDANMHRRQMSEMAILHQVSLAEHRAQQEKIATTGKKLNRKEREAIRKKISDRVSLNNRGIEDSKMKEYRDILECDAATFKEAVFAGTIDSVAAAAKAVRENPEDPDLLDRAVAMLERGRKLPEAIKAAREKRNKDVRRDPKINKTLGINPDHVPDDETLRIIQHREAEKLGKEVKVEDGKITLEDKPGPTMEESIADEVGEPVIPDNEKPELWTKELEAMQTALDDWNEVDLIPMEAITKAFAPVMQAQANIRKNKIEKLAPEGWDTHPMVDLMNIRRYLNTLLKVDKYGKPVYKKTITSMNKDLKPYHDLVE